LPDPPAYAAVDLGASSGRVVLGRLRDGAVELEEVHRFPNEPVRLPDGLHFAPLALLSGALDGIRKAQTAGPLRGVGVDAWGVDYALLAADGRLLGTPFHYRDGRGRDQLERAFALVPAAELYAVTGIQTLPINTVFQLLADLGAEAFELASHVPLVPDLIAYWLCGELVNESTAASTTGLLDATSGQWAHELIERLGLPTQIFGPIVEPGTDLGPILEHHGLGDVPVIAVAAHDTASAFAGAPLSGPGAAVISCGTWSLVGVERGAPVLHEGARAFNVTNERGLDGTVRLLKNVMGLWLIEQSRRALRDGGAPSAYEELLALADGATPDVPLFDPDDDAFLAPGDMPARIAAACARLGQAAPAGPGELVRSILVSLACKYRRTLDGLEEVTGEPIEVVHLIGGGSQNALLCQLTADLSGRPVLAGPVEATALGNVLVQARADGQLGSSQELREAAQASARPVRYEPRDADAAATYERFLSLTAADRRSLPR
jgi:rhamnulokinase